MNIVKMTIGRKFALTGALLMVLTVVLATVSLAGLANLQNALTSLSDDSMAGLSAMSKVESELLEMRGDFQKHIASESVADKEAVEREVDRLRQGIGQDLAAYEKTIEQAEDRAIFVRIQPALDRFVQVWQTVLPVSRAGKTQEAFQKYLSEGRLPFLTVKELLKEESDYNRRTGEQKSAAAQAVASRVRWVTWLVLAAALLSGTACLYMIVRGVNRALLQAVTSLGSGAGQVSSAAGQVSSSSQSLAQGASEQAASLEETSASTEQINSMAQRNTEHSRQAAELVTGSAQTFIHANQLLDGMVTAMDQINASSGKISRIIKVIDEIAFQTNILALNAAVEAARAGEAGMGFAVVADEVRSLAQRSAQAAKDTAELIEESIKRSHDGKTKVDQVAAAMKAISSDAEKVKVLVEEVNLGSQEQARGISQIARAVVQMQEVTQRNAANAEESAAAAEEMNAQASAVEDIVHDLSALVQAWPKRNGGPAPRVLTRPAAELAESGNFVEL
jgi:methyl-accepting chemotaxis protein